MNREIKFRGWSKGNKKMSEVISLLDYDRDFSDGDQIMQFTGLKDKNGKEIFEGDLVKDLETKKVHKVIYEEWAFFLEEFFKARYDWAGAGFSEGTKNFEVIGNIYENPELLKD